MGRHRIGRNAMVKERTVPFGSRKRSPSCAVRRPITCAVPPTSRTVLSACSGHGFKFAPVLGQLMAESILDGVALPAIIRTA